MAASPRLAKEPQFSRRDRPARFQKLTPSARSKPPWGDSLLWAADCVWLQPCSRRLAHALREQFHPHLPADRLQRILQLPDTHSDPDGFRFGTRTRNALRQIWKARRGESERQRVLNFIDACLADAEPEDTQSTAHLAWEALRERFRLEADPRHSPRRLAELARTAASSYVQESLYDFRVGPGPPSDDRTELESARRDPKSCQYLASISDDLGIPIYSRLPLQRWQKAGLGALATLAVVCLLGFLWIAFNPHRQYWEIASTSGGEYQLHKRTQSGSNEVEALLGVWGDTWTPTRPVPLDGESYEVVYRGRGSEPKTAVFGYSSGQTVSISTSKEALPPGKQAWREFVWIPPGSFMMGSLESEVDRFPNERQHSVTITQGFWMAATEVTQQQYRDVMEDKNPSLFSEAGLDAPVENVSWEEARAFCEKLTERERKAGNLSVDWEYRLPTEAQWEYACRAGSQAAYCFGDDVAQLKDYAWFDSNSGDSTHPVAKKKANELGLYDMHGNVWEWCRDLYSDGYGPSAETDPMGPFTGQRRVLRGGGWVVSAGYCRSAKRDSGSPAGRNEILGFRVAAVRVEPARYAGELETVKFGDFEFVKLPAGEFTMGSPDDEVDRDDDETLHRVVISRPFYLGRYEVTQQQWQQLMGTNLQQQDAKDGSTDGRFDGAKGQGAQYPMYHVSWNDAVEFCNKLTEQHRSAGLLPDDYVYTLPTEAQWEYACRAGTATAFGVQDGGNFSSKQANFNGNYPYGTAEKGSYLGRTEEVGKYASNSWKLHDMHGNVWEWCWDWYGTYPKADGSVPAGPGTSQLRVFRGGSWNSIAGSCRSASRFRNFHVNRYNVLGFRVAAVRLIELREREGR